MGLINNGKISLSLFKKRSRSKTRADNNFGTISEGIAEPQKYRKENLNDIDKYYKSTQYDNLMSWETWEGGDTGTSSRSAQPKVIYPFLQVLCDRISAKLIGQETFPDFKIEDDPDFQFFGELVENKILLKAKIQSALLKLPIMGSCFIRTRISNGMPTIEQYDSKYCYPEFSGSGDLEKVEIKYIYEDDKETDHNGKPVKKWYKLELGMMKDILYNNPKYEKAKEPVFEVQTVTDHNLGFVQGTWFRTSFERNSPDGKTFVSDALLSFIDEFNYSLTKAAGASEYGTDPQLIINGMTEDEVGELVKSTHNAWMMGREGKASHLESSNGGVQSSGEFRDRHLQKHILDIARVAVLDPEKIVGSAQSAKAMEVLHGPMIDMINELRPYVKAGLQDLYSKILMTLVILNQRGYTLGFVMPPQYQPVSANISFSWPPIFPMTAMDKQQTISYVMQLTSGNIVSRETALRWLKVMIPDMPIEDIEKELQLVNTQQQFNTWGF